MPSDNKKNPHERSRKASRRYRGVSRVARRRWYWWGIGVLTGASIFMGLLLFASSVVYSRVPSAVSFDEHYEAVDVIVCLTGGRGRIRRALELLDMGYGKRLYIVGVDPAASLNQILREVGWVGPIDNSKIFIDRNSRNTIENALEVRGYMKGEGLRSLLLVSSMYHGRRAAYIFDRVLSGSGYRMHMTWYESDPFEGGVWYRSLTGIWVTVSEYLKFFLTYVRLGFI